MSEPTVACALCRTELAPATAVTTCRACAARGMGGPVRATGEFLIPPEPSSDEAATTSTIDAGAATCAWCGRAGDQVRKLLGQAGVAICDGCVGLAVDVLSAELGPDWRS